MTSLRQHKGKKGYLRMAFAAAAGSIAVTAALFGGYGVANDTPSQLDTAYGPVEPEVINAFEQSAPKKLVTQDPYREQWNDVAMRQRENMADPAKARAYSDFLAQFDPLKGVPLPQQAEDVNRIVNQQTAYWTDPNQYSAPDYWAAPVETVLSHKGDCEDYALLEMDVLRYLGVPENRLFITTVSSTGHAMDGVDHAILLLNEAPDGAPQDFFILSNFQPVLPDDNALIGVNWVMSDSGYRSWRADFILMDARNNDGYWMAPENPFSRVASAGSAPARRGPKIG